MEISENLRSENLKRLDEQIAWLELKSGANRRRFRALKVAQFALAALVIFSAAISKNWQGLLVGVIGVFIVILEALQTLYRFEQNWTKFESDRKALQRERNLYFAKAEAYATTAAPEVLLAERIESWISPDQLEFPSKDAAGTPPPLWPEAPTAAESPPPPPPGPWAPTSPEPSPSSPPPRTAIQDRVTFSVFAPRAIRQSQSFVLDVWAHLTEQTRQVDSLAAEVGREKKVGVKTEVSVTSGTILSVLLEISSLQVLEPVDTLAWEGKPANASFSVEVPSDAPLGTHAGRVTVSAYGVRITKILFCLNIQPSGADPDEGFASLKTTERTVHTAFASYSSLDRNEAFARVQGMKKILPDLDVFLDVLSLRSGQDWEQQLRHHIPGKDVFFLFWSANAACSKEVEKEWRLALDLRGLEYIDPVPLVDPRESPPPKELASLHFNDLYLGYMRSSGGMSRKMEGGI
jgi:hypothetical protein